MVTIDLARIHGYFELIDNFIHLQTPFARQKQHLQTTNKCDIHTKMKNGYILDLFKMVRLKTFPGVNATLTGNTEEMK